MHLSAIFKYISSLRLDGHSIGRKVGDLLEMVVLSSLINNSKFKNKIIIEPKLYGMSGAGHKVEFVIKKESKNLHSEKELFELNNLIGFIECKKVGVEQTINTSYKKNYSSKKFIFDINDTFETNFLKTKFEFKIINKNSENFICIKFNDDTFEEKIETNHRIILAANKNIFKIISNSESLNDYHHQLDKCRIIEISIIENQFTIIINDCLPGPQTPEKAKQASFVALDARKLVSGSFDINTEENKFKSVLILTEFSHWEEKSINMVKASIDICLYVDDKVIIDLFKLLNKEYGNNFLEMISKNQLLNNSDLLSIFINYINKKNNYIYNDFNSNNKYKIDLDDDNQIVFN
ncbi:hypothetical protein N9U75_03065 [Pelagibacteraceae bacterium]|nr:hypothetical protein [Pelagibacteraceae bacterium]